MTVGVGRSAVVIATDDAATAAVLDPWRIDDLDGPVDYYLDLCPIPPEDDGAPRPLPALWHGTTSLLRSTDKSRLQETLLRILSASDWEPTAGRLRVAFMPLIRDGVAVLVPPQRLSALGDRRLRAAGIDAIYTTSSVIDVDTAEVYVDPPLGTGERIAVPLGGWWRPLADGEREPTPGHAVAEVMQTVVGVTADTAASTLRDVASIVQRVPLIPVAAGPDNGIGDLTAALDVAARRQSADR